MGTSIYKIGLWIVGFIIVFSTISYELGWFSEAVTVAKQEFGATAALKKYEWFKTVSSTLDEKKNTIQVYESNIDQMKIDYADTPRPKWEDVDKLQYNQWVTEVSGLKANYNDIVKDYNAQSSKFNWSAFNTTELPKKYDQYLIE